MINNVELIQMCVDIMCIKQNQFETTQQYDKSNMDELNQIMNRASEKELSIEYIFHCFLLPVYRGAYLRP